MQQASTSIHYTVEQQSGSTAILNRGGSAVKGTEVEEDGQGEEDSGLKLVRLRRGRACLEKEHGRWSRSVSTVLQSLKW
jgi:hypothetical protein